MATSNQTLELEIKSTASKATKEIDTLVSKLTEATDVLTNMYLELGQIETKMNKTKTAASNTGQAISKAFDLAKMRALVNTIKRIVTAFISVEEVSIDASEQLNLFNVTFKNTMEDGVTTYSTIGKEATKFKNNIINNFGAASREVTKFMALFQAMGTSSGISEDAAEIMTEGTTQLVYDLSSLYNKETSDVAEALRAGIYAGQTKPLRSYGIDVTQTSIKPIAESLGITESISDMSQGEKQILRYLAALKQAQIAMGDYANTIESPANQQKVFNNLIDECKVALGNLAQWLVAKVLPYLNAFLMVVKAIALALADLLGISSEDYNSGIASSSDIIDSLADSTAKANDNATKLKKTLLGFDEVNNIDTPTSTDTTSAVDSAIDQRLIDAITSYNSGLTEAKMKATEIKDKILDWLGITEEVDAETGEITYHFDEGITPIKIIGTLLGIIGLVKLVGILKTVGNIFTKVTSIGTATKGTVSLLSASNLALLDLAVWAGVAYEAHNLYSDIKSLKEEMESLKETTEHSSEQTQNLADNFWNLYNQGKLTQEQIDNYTKSLDTHNTTLETEIKNMETMKKNKFTETINKWSGAYDAELEVLKNVAEEHAIIVDQYKQLAEQGQLTTDTATDYATALEDQIKVMEELGEDTTDLKKQLNALADGKYEVKVTADMSNAKTQFDNTIKKWKTETVNFTMTTDLDGNVVLKAKANGGIYKNGRWSDVAAYANGGTPMGGELFLAREAGPELVGTIGSHTAVMNNGQIVESVAAGVYRAVVAGMSQSGGNNVEVYVHTDEGTIVDRINKTTKKTGVCPINIPY